MSYQFSSKELEALIEKVVEKTIDRIGQSPSPIVFNTVLPARSAWRVLGFRNVHALNYALQKGLLRLGQEVEDRRTVGSNRPCYYYNIPKCKARLSQPAEKRN
ncbi:MAG: hypothetical protein ACRC8K_18390 [Waterburya sp.]